MEKLKTLDFISNYTDDKTIIKLVNCDNGNTLYTGRSEFLRNDYGDNYPNAYYSIVEWLDNTKEDVLLIYVVDNGNKG